MVKSEQVFYSPVSQYGGSKPDVLKKTVKNVNAWYIPCLTLARNEILTATPEYSCADTPLVL